VANRAPNGPRERGFVGIGLLGMGVVGSTVVQALSERAGALADHVGIPVRLTGVVVRDSSKIRVPAVPAEIMTTHVSAITDNPDTDIVVELMGGEEPAYSILRGALQSGKSVVTANKEVMAKSGAHLLALANENRAQILYEAAVGGGIPLIATMKRGFAGTRTTAVRAIINGTTNYILTRMADDGIDFAEALAEAQAHGYAEADPANDVDGVDAAYKLAIMAGIAFHTPVTYDDVFREGISHLTANDFRYAQELGYTIKLLAIAREENRKIEVRVHPTLIHQETLLAKVSGVHNAVQLDGDLTGQVLLYGRGAGSGPTTSAVLSDIVEIATRLAEGRTPQSSRGVQIPTSFRPMADLEVRYYLRVRVADRPGVLGHIARVLGESAISIASVIQKETDEAAQSAEIVIMTHIARESAVREASTALDSLEIVREIGSIIRVEE
jgi:homoserine dehydrogenase